MRISKQLQVCSTCMGQCPTSLLVAAAADVALPEAPPPPPPAEDDEAPALEDAFDIAITKLNQVTCSSS